ncbi:serine/threonine protein kinase, partial [Streptomyces ardesiacus]
GGSSRGGTPSRGGSSGARSGSRPVHPSRDTTGRNASRHDGGRPAPRSGAGRTAPRTTGTRWRRPANPRLLRQRLFVFVVVTLLVALGIAAAQGCQGPSRGLGDDRGGVRAAQQERTAPPDGPVEQRAPRP